MSLTEHYEAVCAERRGADVLSPLGTWEVVSGAEWCFGRAVPGGGIARGDALKVGHIRREVREWLGAWRLSSLADDVCVVLSELVTNAIRYGDGYFAVRMSRLRLGEYSELHLEVWDGSTDLPCLRDAGLDAESGRGLLLVHGLVSELGGTYGVGDDGRRTWCRIPAQRAA
ncbi:ATP-binding protein [Streptomyces sp. NPDC059943]|uniref:ATP-binding protein n=1 Tax=Streptomyces sp. NPDC059943 TaxID=3347010 RepID=UPI003664D870